MRRIALFGMLLGSLVVSARAAEGDSQRFLETAKTLVQAINADDTAAIHEMFNAAMQNALPAEKATPFFRGLVSAKGELTVADDDPRVDGPTAIVRVAAERGAWDFRISLEPSGKIAGLRITPAAAEAAAPATDAAPADGAAPAAAERFMAVAQRLVAAINADDAAAIQGMFDAAMRQALPPDKAKPFFRGLASASGTMRVAGVPQVDGATANVHVAGERGAWNFKITLDAADRIAGLYVTPAAADPAAGAGGVPRSRVAMQLPFRGTWFVFWGGDNDKVNYHASDRGQRRAADLVIKGAGGLSHKGEGRRNEDYYAFGKEILSAAAGTVVTAIDGVPDNAPSSMNPLCAVGNCLIIDHGSDEYAVYAHLKRGTLRVRAGQKVRAGQVLGLCGNSGNSSEPHLHFHLQDKAVLQEGAGVTPYFADVECRRREKTLKEAEYTFLQGDFIRSAAK